MGARNLGDDLANHEFGSVSTDLKLEVLSKYLSGFTTALRRKFDQLWYVDAYAGTGRRTVRILARDPGFFDEGAEEQLIQLKGSALIAMEAQPAFDRLVFIDLNRRHVAALNALRDEPAHRHLNVNVLRQDANQAIRDLIGGRNFAGTRVVMFLDPYGLSVSWETLQAVAATQAIDVWYFVSLEGLFRQAARDPSKITEKKRAAITRMLGTPDWEKDWYRERRQVEGLFGLMFDEEAERTADVDAIEAYVKKRLETIFAKVLPPLRLKNKAGVNSAALFFAISNPEPRAVGLATRIAGAILKAGSRAAVG